MPDHPDETNTCSPTTAGELAEATRTLNDQRRAILGAWGFRVDMGALPIGDTPTWFSQYGADAGIGAGAAIWPSPPGGHAGNSGNSEKCVIRDLRIAARLPISSRDSCDARKANATTQYPPDLGRGRLSG